ncbi:MAG TPA: polyprenyl synthetase family protein [Treponema sp.]|nr:polyprenyl synthetase family protein [Treponema sp.]
MKQQYIRRLQIIEDTLDRWLPENPGEVWGEAVFPGPGNRPGGDMFRRLTLPGRDLLERGGKRWRPLLMTLVCEALGGGNAALALSPLVEFCHNASLIHDDIEDNSSERRGKPAVHLLYGTDTAINSGSFLYFLSLSCVDSWAAEMEPVTGQSAEKARGAVYALWGEYMRRLHLGQSMDISWHRDFSLLPEIEDYLVMCALKTGCLARFAAALGTRAAACVNVRAAELETEIARTLGEAAEKIGVGFQILDDVKNLSGGIAGKQRGDDIVEGKKSLPVLLYTRRYPEKREFVFGCFAAARERGVDAPEARELIENLEAAGILGEARERGLAFIAEGRKIFSSALCENFPALREEHALLEGLVDLIS